MRQQNVPAWQAALADGFRDPAQLLAFLGLDAAGVDLPSRPLPFPLRVPRGFAARMRAGDPRDPLLVQVLPRAAEDESRPGYVGDPVGDHRAMARPGVLHKYRGRVLLTTTGACAIHCRYCFRREFPYARANPRRDDWREALDYVAADTSIEEVILSGGDPLTVSDARLAGLVRRIEAIPHVRTLRLHTRMPVVLPERIDSALLEWLGATRLQPVVVLHANHGNELDAGVAAAAARLRRAGATLLNQSVLLRGVNDSAAALADLSRRLFALGALPYYLHLLDPVRGAAHFDVTLAAARRLHAELSARLPGYLVPRLVREEAGRPGKTRLDGTWPADVPAAAAAMETSPS